MAYTEKCLLQLLHELDTILEKESSLIVSRIQELEEIKKLIIELQNYNPLAQTS